MAQMNPADAPGTPVHRLPADVGTYADVAARIGPPVTARNLRQWRYAGRLPFYRVGGRVMVSEAEAEVRALMFRRVEATGAR